MNEAERAFIEKWAMQIGPTVQGARQLLEVMNPLPVCVACSAARWYKVKSTSGETLECFCTEFRGTMYNGGRAVTACDAREDVIARHQARL